MLTKSALPGARRADVTGFGVPEHHGDGSALPMLVQSGSLSLKPGHRVDVGLGESGPDGCQFE